MFPPFSSGQPPTYCPSSLPRRFTTPIDLNFHRKGALPGVDWAWRWTILWIYSKSCWRLARGLPPYSLPRGASCRRPHQPSSKPYATSSHARIEYSMCDRTGREQSAASIANRHFVERYVLCWICEEEDFVYDFVGLDMNIDDLCWEEGTFPGHHG